jgi:hypothetical protein
MEFRIKSETLIRITESSKLASSHFSPPRAEILKSSISRPKPVSYIKHIPPSLSSRDLNYAGVGQYLSRKATFPWYLPSHDRSSRVQ